MKNCSLFFATLLLIVLEAYGQMNTTKVNVTWGDKKEINRKTIFEDIIGSDDDGTYIIKRTWKGYALLIIEKYGNERFLKNQ